MIRWQSSVQIYLYKNIYLFPDRRFHYTRLRHVCLYECYIAVLKGTSGDFQRQSRGVGTPVLPLTVTWLVLICHVQGNRDLLCGDLSLLNSFKLEGQFTLNMFFFFFFNLFLSKHWHLHLIWHTLLSKVTYSNVELLKVRILLAFLGITVFLLLAWKHN